MALSVPSRFACLKIEDDDFRPPSQSKGKEKKKVDQKPNSKKTDKNGTAKKQSVKVQAQPKKEKKKRETAEQWEEWKEKDRELVKETYEEDLENALMLSMIDYEERKKVKVNSKEADADKKDSQKKKKCKPMSLEQFNTMVSNNGKDTKAENGDVGHLEENELNDKFFERVKTETKVELNKELKRELNKDKGDSKKIRRSFNDETITIAQYQTKLEAQQKENALLKAQLERYKKEISAVKERNKSLCGMLANAEMKDKADVLIELERLSKVRDELTEEVTRLHGLLEQERSKVGALTSDPHQHNKHSKDKNKKN